MSERPVKVIGELVVVAIKARELPNREVVGKQDPFVTFRLGETAKRTKTDYRGGQHPVWDDQVNLPVPEKKTTMYVQVFDEDGSREDLISEGDIDLTNVLREGEEDNWYPLKYRGKKAGEIYIELTFYSARPPPKRQPTRLFNKRPNGYNQQQGPAYAQHQYTPQQPQYTPQQQQQQSQYLSRPPPVPTASTSTPARTSAGPPVYRPPAVRPEYDHAATPHMPQTLTPSSSTGTASSVGGNMYTTRPSGHHHTSSLGGGYPPATAGYAPSQPVGFAPLLSSSYRPQTPVYGQQQQQQQQHPGGPTPMGFRPPAPYPPQNQAGYPPPQPTPSMGFPEPQRFTGDFSPHHDQYTGQPFAAHQSPYPPNQGYPPNPGFPPQQGYPPQPGNYPPVQHGYPPPQHGYPPAHPSQ